MMQHLKNFLSQDRRDMDTGLVIGFRHRPQHATDWSESPSEAEREDQSRNMQGLVGAVLVRGPVDLKMRQQYWFLFFFIDANISTIGTNIRNGQA